MIAARYMTSLKSISSLISKSSLILSCRQVNKFSSFAGRKAILNRSQNLVNHLSSRNKYDKRSSASNEEEDSDDETEFLDEIDKKTTAKVTVQSLRADLLLKQGIGMARNKIETAFYENRIRINGKKIQKKSLTCKVGDEIDLIKGESPTNSNHLLIARIEIVSTKPKLDGISVTMRRFKSLTVEKYD